MYYRAITNSFILKASLDTIEWLLLVRPAFSLLRPRSSNRLEAAEAEEAEAEEGKVLKALSSSLCIALS